MRRKVFWSAWIVFFLLPVAYGVEIFMKQDLPPVPLWKWAILVAVVAVIILSRNRDDVLKHHVV